MYILYTCLHKKSLNKGRIEVAGRHFSLRRALKVITHGILILILHESLLITNYSLPPVVITLFSVYLRDNFKISSVSQLWDLLWRLSQKTQLSHIGDKAKTLYCIFRVKFYSNFPLVLSLLTQAIFPRLIVTLPPLSIGNKSDCNKSQAEFFVRAYLIIPSMDYLLSYNSHQ